MRIFWKGSEVSVFQLCGTTGMFARFSVDKTGKPDEHGTNERIVSFDNPNLKVMPDAWIDRQTHVIPVMIESVAHDIVPGNYTRESWTERCPAEYFGVKLVPWSECIDLDTLN